MKERKHYLDFLRVIATFAVIVIHVFTTARTDFPVHTALQDSTGLIMVQLMHFCVPIFLMISGSLFLKNTKEIPLKKLYGKYILKYVVVILTFGFAMALMEEYFDNGLSGGMILPALVNVLMGKTWAHMWYLYMLIGLMALVPLIKPLYNKIAEDRRLMNYYLALGAIANFLIPSIASWFNYELPIAIPLFSNYIYFFILGNLLDEKKIVMHDKICVAGIIISSSMIVLANLLYMSTSLDFLKSLGGYDSPLILISSVGIFGLFKNHEATMKSGRILSFLSNYSFGVYLFHMLWINIAYKLIDFNIYDSLFVLKSIGVFLATAILSYASSYVCKKMPVIKRYI